MAAGVSPRTCRRLMTFPGVGQLTALAFVAAIDDHQLDTWAVAIVQKSSPTRASRPTPLTFETSKLPLKQIGREIAQTPRPGTRALARWSSWWFLQAEEPVGRSGEQAGALGEEVAVVSLPARAAIGFQRQPGRARSRNS
jgi:hypothetical protein